MFLRITLEVGHNMTPCPCTPAHIHHQPGRRKTQQHFRVVLFCTGNGFLAHCACFSGLRVLNLRFTLLLSRQGTPLNLCLQHALGLHLQERDWIPHPTISTIRTHLNKSMHSLNSNFLFLSKMTCKDENNSLPQHVLYWSAILSFCKANKKVNRNGSFLSYWGDVCETPHLLSCADRILRTNTFFVTQTRRGGVFV